MAQHRTKAHKQQVQVRREGEALSYRLPAGSEKSKTTVSLKATPASPAVTETLLRQPLALVYQDLIKTVVVSVCMMIILMLVVRFA